MTEETADPRDLNALVRACPLGWVELQIEHHPGDSGPGGSTPQEPDTSICQLVMAEQRRLALCSACGITFIAPVGLEELEGA